MTVASQVLVFIQDNSNHYIETQLQHVKELRGKAEKEVSQYTLQSISSQLYSIVLLLLPIIMQYTVTLLSLVWYRFSILSYWTLSPELHYLRGLG